MERFQQQIKKRIIVLKIALVPLVFLLMNTHTNWIALPVANVNVLNFQQGILVGVTFLFCVYLFRYRASVNNEDALILLYNQEHDERQISIRRKAGVPVLLITSITMLLLSIIIGYYNVTIFYVLAITGVVQIFISAILKTIFMKIS